MTETVDAAEDELGGIGDPADPPMHRMAVAVLSLIGFFVAAYLFAHNAGLLGEIVCGVGDCATVQSSEYATVGPIPELLEPGEKPRDAQIVDSLRMTSDSFFRSAAENARRAVYRCSPFDLPPRKYEIWQVMTLRFDPSRMFGG